MNSKQDIVEMIHVYWNDGSDLPHFTSKWMKELTHYSEHAVESAYTFISEHFRHQPCPLKVFSTLCQQAERGVLVRPSIESDGINPDQGIAKSAPYCWKVWR